MTIHNNPSSTNNTNVQTQSSTKTGFIGRIANFFKSAVAKFASLFSKSQPKTPGTSLGAREVSADHITFEKHSAFPVKSASTRQGTADTLSPIPPKKGNADSSSTTSRPGYEPLIEPKATLEDAEPDSNNMTPEEAQAHIDATLSHAEDLNELVDATDTNFNSAAQFRKKPPVSVEESGADQSTGKTQVSENANKGAEDAVEGDGIETQIEEQAQEMVESGEQGAAKGAADATGGDAIEEDQ